MAATTPNLGLRYLVYKQLRGDLTINENYDLLDGSVGLVPALIDVTTVTPSAAYESMLGYRRLPTGGSELCVCMYAADGSFSWVQILQNV